MERYNEITELLYKHLTNELTQEEKGRLDNWVQESDANKRFYARYSDARWVVKEALASEERERSANIKEAWEKLLQSGLIEPTDEVSPAKVYRLRWRKFAIAASVILFITVGLWLGLKREKTPGKETVQTTVPVNDAKPLTNAARIVLDNGQELILDSLKSGVIARQGNMMLVRDEKGAIRYSIDNNQQSKETIYNTVYVPKGSEVVHLSLEDGSKVWLNAESSIRYPVVFSREERKVEIDGEAYFEAAPSSTRRFIVSKGNMNVIVLGTKFNVNTYENEENIKVTLLEGSVKVKKENAQKIIKPGQQAVIGSAKINVLDDVDLEQVMAWKNGKFVFRSTNLQLIMRQMARWYDLDTAEYKYDEVKGWGYTGEISRYNKASAVLEMLARTGGGEFRIEGKKIIISK